MSGPDTQVEPQSLQLTSGHQLLAPFIPSVNVFQHEVLYSLQVVGNALSLPIKDLSPGFCVSLHRVLRQDQNLDPDFHFLVCIPNT